MQDYSNEPIFEILPFRFGSSRAQPFRGEAFEAEWQNEFSPGSRAFNRWVQESLNKIMGLRLATDGDIGAQSRSAIRSFQQKYGLAVDGLVGKQTEAAIKAALQQGGPAGPATAPLPQKLPSLGPNETAEYNQLSPLARGQFDELRKTIAGYTGMAKTEADRGSRVLLERGVFRALPGLLPEVLTLTKVSSLPSGWSLSTARPLLVGNVLYNLAFPETINQGGSDRLGGKGDPTCFSASTQILLARRFPVTYVRYVNQLAASGKVQFAGGSYSVPTGFVSTSLYKSLDSVLLQTAFDTYFNVTACFISCEWFYQPGDELKVHRQVFGADRPPRTVTWGDKASMRSAFRKAFVTDGGNTRLPEIANLCTGDPSDPKKCGNHTVVVTRITSGRVYFYNPWPNELERNQMFGTVNVTISGNGERPAESSMAQADFENQLTAVFHN